nr:DNA oxidative demethylase [Ipomoea batatas]
MMGEKMRGKVSPYRRHEVVLSREKGRTVDGRLGNGHGLMAFNGSKPTPSEEPSDGVGKVLFGGQITDEEAQSLNKRKPCSGYKLKEMNGSNIFSADGENDASESGTNGNLSNRTSVRIVQQAANGISQISFSTEEKISPKKPTTIPEVAKQRELSGTLESESDLKIKKQLSDAKCKELSGNDIFGPPSEAPPRSLTVARTMESKESNFMGEPAPRNVRTSVKVSNPAGGQSNIMFGDEPVVKTTKKIHDQKFAELTGNDIFKGDVPGLQRCLQQLHDPEERCSSSDTQFLIRSMSTSALVVTTLVRAHSSVPSFLIAIRRTFSKYFSGFVKQLIAALSKLCFTPSSDDPDDLIIIISLFVTDLLMKCVKCNIFFNGFLVTIMVHLPDLKEITGRPTASNFHYNPVASR